MNKDKHEDCLKRLADMLPTEQDKINMIATMLGMSAEQSLYISSIKDSVEVPDKVNYAIAMTMINMLAYHTGDSVGIGDDLGLIDLPPKEKLIRVLKEIIEVYKDDLK
jgi:hypothetical protein